MNLIKYIDKLPILPTVKPLYKKGDINYFEMKMNQFYTKMHSSLPDTLVWGFDGLYPGPTIEVKQYDKIQIKWMNELPPKHLFSVDKTIHGAEGDTPEVRTVIHVHGGITHAPSDGYPDAWFTNGFKQVGSAFTQEVYHYFNTHEATTLWYHDHTIGITRLNIYAGLAGFYLIRDKNELSLSLPKGKYEIPLMIQDRTFNPDGSLYYPEQPPDAFEPTPKFFGDTIVVNGKVWPYLDVEPRRYRFRMLNGSNSRYYILKLDNGQPFIQIGNDGGFLEKPVIMKEILLGPAERADVIIDFSDSQVNKIVLLNLAPKEYPKEGEISIDTTGQIMQFRVTLPLMGKDVSKVPARLRNVQFLKEEDAVINRVLTLVRSLDDIGRRIVLINNQRWDEPTTEKPKLGDTEIWTFINSSVSVHPIHLHLVNVQILDRQSYDQDLFLETGEIKLTSEKRPPAENETGWKDTVNSNPGEIIRIITKFEPYTGKYVFHCHILEHEDYEMMRPYEVVKKSRFFYRLKSLLSIKTNKGNKPT
ncbi:multicopper oxidase family protein [Chengkuizengella sediminis]|uniref:multicopper oxidase family protein n=1 Tax=Chengkuizengella sediminis TaxID=1885917 RepID=UPI001389AC49|nr:multicopper oxidase [Chengkuizengella sediminis]NDI35682.1 multicopper oxidase domain-containing protein [Chengkuizengella sediminis]